MVNYVGESLDYVTYDELEMTEDERLLSTLVLIIKNKTKNNDYKYCYNSLREMVKLYDLTVGSS